MVDKKKGFSLVEAIIASTILIIVLVLATTVSTKKTPQKNNTLNSFKCWCGYNDAGDIERQSQYITNGRIIPDTYTVNNDECLFYPPAGSDLYTIKVWNELYSTTDSVAFANNYAVLSFPKKEIKIKLGNIENPDISVEEVLTTQIKQGRCFNNLTKEECINDGDDNTNWILNHCIVHINENEENPKQICTDAGNNWLETNPCMLGINVEVDW